MTILSRWIVVSLLGASSIASAQQNAPQSKTPQPNPFQTRTSLIPDTAPSSKPVQVSPPMSTGQAVYLVRSTLMTLNDANRSGNYTVLRDLAAPDFQTRNSAADLAQSFIDLRRRKFDLFAVSFTTPQFDPEPSLDGNGRMRLSGSFATHPLQIKFDLTFQSVEGQWRLFAVSVATPEAPKEQGYLSRPSLPRRFPEGFFYGVRLFSATGGWRW